MKIVEREHIDEESWNQLVDKTVGASFFSYAWYLDATAENWCIVVDDNYTRGIALPYSKRLGLETLYTPIFVRYIEWLGEKEGMEETMKIIRSRFQNMHIAVRQKLFGVGYEEYVFQEIASEETRKLGSQGKRMLKKALKNELSVQVSEAYTKVAEIVHRELNGKFEGIDTTSLKALNILFESGSKAGVLKAYEVGSEGGIVCFEKKDRTLYLKGTVTSQTKASGGMYLALNTAIEHTLKLGKVFDFGGSRADGVRRFNQNLGGDDVQYYVYKVDKTPFWFKFARRIRNSWKK